LTLAANTEGVPFSRILTNSSFASTILFGVASRDDTGAEISTGSEDTGSSRPRVAIVLHLTTRAFSVPKTPVGTMRSCRSTIIVLLASRCNAVSGSSADSVRPLVTISVTHATCAAGQVSSGLVTVRIGSGSTVIVLRAARYGARASGSGSDSGQITNSTGPLEAISIALAANAIGIEEARILTMRESRVSAIVVLRTLGRITSTNKV